MLAAHFGELIRNHRVARHLKQEDLARLAGVSRTTLSRLEQGKAPHVQTDVIDRILGSLAITPRIGLVQPGQERVVARLEQQARMLSQREHHLRLMLELAGNPATAVEKIARAREMVALWRQNRTCSAFYIDQWQSLLSLPVSDMAQAMLALGDWEDALFQNSPWAWAWNSKV